MRTVALVFACVPFSGHARRVQTLQTPTNGNDSPLEGLAHSLLAAKQDAFSMPAGFAPRHRSSAPQMVGIPSVVPPMGYGLIGPLPTEGKPFAIPELPYDYSSLEPGMSTPVVKSLYEDQHAWYVDALNMEMPETDMTLEDAAKSDDAKTAYLASEVYSHNFFWKSMSSNGGGSPTGAIKEYIRKGFGSVSNFDIELKVAADFYGNGVVWLVQTDGKLEFISLPAGKSQMPTGRPILAMKFPAPSLVSSMPETEQWSTSWLSKVNWEFANSNLDTTAKHLPKDLLNMNKRTFKDKLKPSQKKYFEELMKAR